jgi:hypothetical protein
MTALLVPLPMGLEVMGDDRFMTSTRPGSIGHRNAVAACLVLSDHPQPLRVWVGDDRGGEIRRSWGGGGEEAMGRWLI